MNFYALVVLATLASTARVFGLILLSIITGWLFGYISINSKIFENIYISLNEVLESVPVITFFPIVLIFFVYHIGGYLGAELAADFLILTAVVWNIWMGIYQAFKTIPLPMVEAMENLRMKTFDKLRYLYIPFSMPRIAANLIPSFTDAFFYITVSEVFTVGLTSFHVFGIGYLIVNLINNNLWNLVYFSLLVLGIIIAISILGLREFANYSIAKYALESEIPLQRYNRLRYVARLYSPLTTPRRIINTFTKKYLSNPMRKTVRLRKLEEKEKEKEVSGLIYRIIGSIIGISILALLIYGIYNILSSTTYKLWIYLLNNTWYILINLAYDYIRVAIIALISFSIAMTLSYYLATHKKIESIFIPIIQIIAAYPPPIYFPLIFAATFAIIERFFGGLSIEFYVLLLGFLSTFYYIFYAVWLGIKAIPQEYWEVMNNFNMNYWQKMRYIILPSTFPYTISGLTSTINSAWGGLMIGEYWINLDGHNIEVRHGLMKLLDISTAEGNIALAGWASFIFGIIVVIFAILFTRKMMELAKEKYVMEEGIFAA
ncbi:ABC-type anion transport system, duplicated permease component [Caldisphaera lagunensis DSM 15908]|uniref:ABC-type anion transport system, duplicated permease component n=1 Tax=Caldisphaera lagunensis (strain DSM 15908 / JCM 11604 / ANMR 0165 / IC-154) TaxID=1056495 RepID=L0ABC4_CALLD|nr:ABC transporter permease subunit [Caldisphaera lagunensis]AFZ70437.1 ABC-type anion transport system, duplicated permease component [Caldisphaera lagunensis DSM 15908]